MKLEKFIYFAGNDKDCEKLVAGLKNAELVFSTIEKFIV
jgi:hypothetical protein